jgi:hypothetical protein
MTTSASFPKFEDFVLSPPLPAVLSILMTSGVAYVGWRLASRLRRGRPDAIDVGAGFVVAATCIAVIVHALALAQLSKVAVLRPGGWLLAALGAWALVRHRRALFEAGRAGLASLRESPRWVRAGAVIAAIATFGLGAAALGPVTDMDSLHYHLCVPLEWLRHGGAYARPDWFHSRLVGIGESLNLLGLAAGTDGFGAALQFAGLVIASVALGALATTSRDRVVAWLVVVSCPVFAFLVASQKPQMLPAAGTTVALVLAVKRFDDFAREDAFLVFVCAAFAMACKTSFLLTAGFVVLLGLVAAWRSGRLLAAFGIAAVVVGVALGPLLARNYAFYGDPIPPFLERFKAHPDPALLEFAQTLREMGGEHTLATFLMLPLTLVGTIHPAAITSVLGLGTLAFLPAVRTPGRARMFLGAALAAALTCVVLGQLAPRFFLDPYLWAGVALGGASWGRLKKVVVAGIFVQGAVAAVIGLFCLIFTFPGALSSGLRERVLTRFAAGYPEGKWLDQLLPPDAVVSQANGRFRSEERRVGKECKA